MSADFSTHIIFIPSEYDWGEGTELDLEDIDVYNGTSRETSEDNSPVPPSE